MDANLSLADLIKQPNFGVNVIRKLALENLAASAFIDYSLKANNTKLSILTLYPNKRNEEQPYRKFIEIKLDKNDEKIVKLFENVINGVYLNKGELLGNKLKEDVVVIRTEHLNARLSYGTDPKLLRINRSNDGINVIHFTSIKDGTVKTHQANWSLVDIATEITDSIIVPKNLFSTFREFDKIISELLEVPVGRFVYKQDPTEVNEDFMDIYINKEDLVYRGKLRVYLPPKGEKARLVPFNTNDVEPEDGEVTVVATFVDNAGKDVVTAKTGDTFKLKLVAENVKENTVVNLVADAGKAEVLLDKESITFTSEVNTVEVEASVISVVEKSNLVVNATIGEKKVATSSAVELTADLKLTAVAVTPNTATLARNSSADFDYTLTPAGYVPKVVDVALSKVTPGVTVASNKDGKFKVTVDDTPADGVAFDVVVTVDGVVGKTAITIKVPELPPEGDESK